MYRLNGMTNSMRIASKNAKTANKDRDCLTNYTGLLVGIFVNIISYALNTRIVPLKRKMYL